MIEFKGLSGVDNEGRPIKLTIAAGPVIIEQGKVILDKHGDDNFWKFPGGRLADDNSPRQNAIRVVKEELGLTVELKGDPFVVAFTRTKDKVNEYVILIHYLATRRGEVKRAPQVREWVWQDINSLPADCAPNIKPAVRHFSGKI